MKKFLRSRLFNVRLWLASVMPVVLPLSLVSSALASDISITATTVTASSQASKSIGVAGATITAGQLLYLDTSTNTWKLADANASATTAHVGGIALSGAASGQAVIVCTADPSFTIGATVAAGAVLVASATAGGIAPVADLATGLYPTIVGIGIGSNKIKLSLLAGGVAVP